MVTEDELRAILKEHRAAGHVHHDGSDCCVCAEEWPCETYRLATEVKDLRAVKDAAEPQVRHSMERLLIDPDDWYGLGERWLARYEEGRTKQVTDIALRPGELRAMLATIDALTTENATLKAEIEGYRQALEKDLCPWHGPQPEGMTPYPFEEPCGTKAFVVTKPCERVRRVLAGKEAQG